MERPRYPPCDSSVRPSRRVARSKLRGVIFIPRPFRRHRLQRGSAALLSSGQCSPPRAPTPLPDPRPGRPLLIAVQLLNSAIQTCGQLNFQNLWSTFCSFKFPSTPSVMAAAGCRSLVGLMVWSAGALFLSPPPEREIYFRTLNVEKFAKRHRNVSLHVTLEGLSKSYRLSAILRKMA